MRKNTMRFLAMMGLGAVIFTLGHEKAHASAVVDGTLVDTIFIRKDGIALVKLATTPTNIASCATTDPDWRVFLVMNTNTEAGKQMYSLLLSAHLAKRHVKVEGANTCTILGNNTQEDIGAAWLRPD
jgi:hypothetical protein